MPEIWKSVAGYEGFYEVSSMGRVRSVARELECDGPRGWHGIRHYQSRLLKPTTAKTQLYPAVVLSRCGEQRHVRVHILVLETFIGPCPKSMEARHLDGKHLNARLDNLSWGTSQENAADRALHGTVCNGERNAHSKLTDEKVRQMRSLHARGVPPKRIAELHGLHIEHTYLVLQKKAWRHV